MIRIVNKKNFNGKGIYIGRPSPLGNPFAIGKDGDRDEVIRKYRIYLKKAMETNNRIKEIIERIKELSKKEDVYLICWCFPKKCHGEVIKEIVENLS